MLHVVINKCCQAVSADKRFKGPNIHHFDNRWSSCFVSSRLSKIFILICVFFLLLTIVLHNIIQMTIVMTTRTTTTTMTMITSRWVALIGLHGEPPEVCLLWACSCILWPSSVPPDFLLHWFWPPTANVMPPNYLLLWLRHGWHPSVIEWLVEAGLLCAKPPNCYQVTTVGPLDVNR